jgi:hypothetical protein
VLGRSRSEVAGRSVFVFEAELLDVGGVSARVAVAGHEHLSELHEAIQQAFNWEDDHLYSFWLDGEFWSRDGEELVRPGTTDTDSRTADVPVGELRLKIGSQIAYVFDYGDEWRVMLTLRERADGGSTMPRSASDGERRRRNTRQSMKRSPGPSRKTRRLTLAAHRARRRGELALSLYPPSCTVTGPGCEKCVGKHPRA